MLSAALHEGLIARAAAFAEQPNALGRFNRRAQLAGQLGKVTPACVTRCRAEKGSYEAASVLYIAVNHDYEVFPNSIASRQLASLLFSVPTEFDTFGTRIAGRSQTPKIG